MTSHTPHLSVVVPAYSASDILERNLPILLRYLHSLDVTWEVLIVDDGSDDSGRTREVSERHGCVYIGLERNRGKGAAVRTGMIKAAGTFRMFTDADVPFEVACIGRMLYYLDFKEFHMVAGDRTLPESVYFTAVPRSRRIGSAIASFVVGRFVTTGWFDTQCGLKGFRADVAIDLFGVSRVEGFAFDVELFYIALKRNYDIKRLPVQLRANDSSSVRLWSAGLSFVRDIWRIRINQFLGRYAVRQSEAEREAST